MAVMANAVTTHTAENTLNSAAVGDFVTVALVETMSAGWLEALSVVGIEIATSGDDRLVLVDAE